MRHSIWTAALIALICAPAPRTQDRPPSMASKLLERLDRMAQRLDDEELQEDLRAEIADLLEMMREQLSQGRSQVGEAADLYRRAASEALRDLDLGKLGDQLHNLHNLRSLEALQEVEKLDADDLRDLLGRANRSLQRGADLLEGTDLLGRLRERNLLDVFEPALQRVNQVLQDALESIPEETVDKILEAVREALGDRRDVDRILESVRQALQSRDEDATARNLYRSLLERGTDRFQEAPQEWQKYLEEGNRQWQKYADEARQQWEKYLEEGRQSWEKQMQEALEAWRKARGTGTGEGETPGTVFDMTAPQNWFSTEGGSVYWQSPKEGEGGEGTLFYRPKGEGEPRVYSFTPSTEGGSVFWTAPDWEKAGTFNVAPPPEGGWYRVTPEGKTFEFLPFDESGNRSSKPVEGGVRTWRTEGEREAETGESQPARSFLESFRQGMSRRSTGEPEEGVETEEAETEAEVTEVAEPEFVEPVEEPELVEIAEPVLLETGERPTSEEDVNERIRDMVEELRNEMREIRELVRALRDKARSQTR